jgi:hypothetical protein
MTYYLITCDINALYRTGTGSVQDRPNALYRGGKARTCPLPPLYRKKGHVRGPTGSYEVHIKNLELIREVCKSIMTLKLSLQSDCAIRLSQNKHQICSTRALRLSYR